MAPNWLRPVRRLIGDLLTIAGILALGSVAALVVFLVLAVLVVNVFLGPGWELGPD